jgi:hypothetical protein
LIEGRSLGAIHINFRKHRKRNAIVEIAELLDLIIGAGLLPTELIARKPENREALIFKFLVQSFEPSILGREPTLAGDIHHERNLVRVLRERIVLRLGIFYGEFGERLRGWHVGSFWK